MRETALSTEVGVGGAAEGLEQTFSGETTVEQAFP